MSLELTSESILDGSTEGLTVGAFDVKGAVFIIPIDAPIPSEISSGVMPTGSLYQRLAPLDVELSESFTFVPVSGAELLALERCWRMLQSARRIFVLNDLPAARYDVLFSQAVRQIGLPKVDWTHVSEAISAKVITDQRSRDKTPWAAPMADGVELPPRARKGPHSSTGRQEPLPVPGADDEDQA